MLTLEQLSVLNAVAAKVHSKLNIQNAQKVYDPGLHDLSVSHDALVYIWDVLTPNGKLRSVAVEFDSGRTELEIGLVEKPDLGGAGPLNPNPPGTPGSGTTAEFNTTIAQAG